MVKSYLYIYAKKNVSRWLVLLIDISLVVQLFVLAYFIRYNFSLNFNLERLFKELPIVAIFALFSFLISGSYKGVIRHTGLKDALNVYIGVSMLSGFLIITVLLNRLFGFSFLLDIPISMIVIHYLLNIIVLISSRFVFKHIYRTITLTGEQSKIILIYGAGAMGVIAYETLTKAAREHYKVIGFIDDDPSRSGHRINRMPIYDMLDITEDFVRSNQLIEVVIAIQKIKPRRLLEIMDRIQSLGLEVKIAPPFSEWVDGNLQIGQIQPVRIEDLLDRAPINLCNTLVEGELKDKVVLISGAAGSIGSEISRQIAGYNCPKIILVDQSESALYDLEQELKRKGIENACVQVADVRDYTMMEAIYKREKPDIVFHAAAYKHVPLMEENPYQAIKTNINGTKNLADLSVKYGVLKFVMVSTDKAVNPTNVMGASKRISEMYVTSLNGLHQGKTKFITTRFGNVLGSNGSVIPLFKKQIENGGPLTLTHKEITRYFMTIPEACQLVIEAGSMGNGGEIFIFDMGKSVKIYDLAVRMIQLSGLRYPEDIEIKITGLRPGEKLYEELLNDSESSLPTHHEKIMIGKVTPLDIVQTIAAIDKLCIENTVGDSMSKVCKMKAIVPEFISKNSIYSSLDKVESL